MYILSSAILPVLGKTQSDKNSETEQFNKIDLNKDQVITREEALHHLLTLDALPADQKILKDTEYVVNEIIINKDADKNGFLTIDEFFHNELGIEEHAHMMNMDTDGDQKISRDELLKFLLKRINRSEEASGAGAENKNTMIDEMFLTQDIDKDGVLSFEEFKSEHDDL